jgi:transposase
VVNSSGVKASPVAGPAGSTARRRPTGSNATSSSTAPEFWWLLLSPRPTCRIQNAFPKLLAQAKRIAPTTTHVWVDKGYTGSTVADAAAKAAVTVDVVSGPKPGRGFIVQPRRWVVEPTNGWINHCRRPDRHHEVTLAAHERFLILSQIALLLRRLDRTQLFDTP